jgi:glycosyltransferase involved in cell wall biosynthesis
MRVLFVEFVPGFGGSLTAAIDTVNALGREIEPILMIPYDPTPYCRIPPHLQLKVVASPTLPPRRVPGKLVSLFRDSRMIMKWVGLVDEVVRATKPALIHANNSAAANHPAGIVGRRRGIPVVSHERVTDHPGWREWLALKSRVFSHHIAVSHPAVRSLERLGVPPNRCTVIYDPTPPPPRDDRPLKENGQPLTVAMYSMLMWWKGHDVFLRAISEVRRRASRPFRAVIGGGEPFAGNGYLNRLKQLTNELGLESCVEFTGFTRSVYEKLRETDILVLASIGPEPGGHIVQEAMMCGVAVVTTDDGGPSEYARSSDGAIVVPRNDVSAMADAIERLLLDRDLRMQIAQRAQDYARRVFDPTAVGDEILTVYRNCLARR